MPDNVEPSSTYTQESFVGGMNLQGDDTRLLANQYRIMFNGTNRDDQLDGVLVSVEDKAIPLGIKQEMITFGKYIIVFIAGFAYYRFYTDSGWRPIVGFQMSSTATRFWTVAVPVSTTNYIRIAATGVTNTNTSNPAGAIQLSSVLGASAGNLPGLLVQDNINQPMFIFLNDVGIPIARTTQTFVQWNVKFTTADNTVVATDPSTNFPLDNREYVPIGSSMTWDNGVLYITSQDGNNIYPSVTGRPLDFVRNVTNVLATVADADGLFTQLGGGDATTTSYSVGVGGIVCLRSMSSGGIFVAAGNANFLVSQNTTPNAPTVFGEYTFIRTFLFNATCLSDRVILDTLGDTRFISLDGIRSFNAVEQTKNEGRNLPFSKTIQNAFGSIIQDPTASAAILFNDYELYGVNTVFGFSLAKYDTITPCWTSFDTTQAAGKSIKIFAKIELDIQRLFCITTDDRLFTLYIGPEQETATVRTKGVCHAGIDAETYTLTNSSAVEVKPTSCRVIVNNVTEDVEVSVLPFVNNRVANSLQTKTVMYSAPTVSFNSADNLPDVNTQLDNLFFTFPNCKQGWKMFALISWTGGSITQYSVTMNNNTPMNPLNSQSNAK